MVLSNLGEEVLFALEKFEDLFEYWLDFEVYEDIKFRDYLGYGAEKVYTGEVKIGKKMLVDGGILNQVPADIAKKLGADLIIAVNVTSNYKTVNQVENMIDVIENVAVVQQQVLFDLKGKNYNFLIEHELTEMRLMDFKKIDYAINSGKQATEKIINEIVAFKKTKQEKLDKKIQKTLEMQKSKI